MSIDNIIDLYRQGYRLEYTEVEYIPKPLSGTNIGSMQTPKPSPCPPLGDVDGDGLVSTTDADWIAQYTVGQRTLTPEQLARADVDGNGIVDIVDALFISQYLVGSRDTFPACTAPTPVLTSISPPSVTIAINNTQQFTALDQNNSPITTGVTWAKVSGIGLINIVGLYSAGTIAGNALISVTYGGITKQASITVTTVIPVLTSIQISPTSASVAPGSTRQFIAICKDISNNVMTCPTLIWSNNNSSVATIDLVGLVTGISVGTANITASAVGVTSNTSVVTVATIPTIGTIIFSITSDVQVLADVMIKVDNINRGYTDVNGILSISDLTIGISHSYIATKSGYNSVSGDVILDTTSKGIQILMTQQIAQAGGTGMIIIAGLAVGALYLVTKKKIPSLKDKIAKIIQRKDISHRT